jgi:hypothetical protein
MVERRRFPRLKIKLPVKIRVFDKETNGDVTNDINAYTENVSKAGMCLMLPRSWDCPECNNCLGWIYNLGCKLKNNHTQDDYRSLANELVLKVSIFDDLIPNKEPIQLEGNCVWVKTDVPPEENSYSVGIYIPETYQKRLSSYFSDELAT